MVIRLSFVSRPSYVTLKSLARLPKEPSQGKEPDPVCLLNRKAIPLEKSPHHGILCNYTLLSISMVHGNGSGLLLSSRKESLLAC